LAGAADERLSLGIFVCARGFADENKPGRGIPDAENDLYPMCVKLAPPTIPQFLAHLFKRRSNRGGGGRRLGPMKVDVFEAKFLLEREVRTHLRRDVA
jgi:hypothetical protein